MPEFKIRKVRCCVAAMAFAASSASWAQTSVLTQEPPAGTLKTGEIVYVDDGSCPKGQIKQVAGAQNRHSPRTRRCVARFK